MIRQYIRETVLYREALALGLDKDDQVIRRRLGQKMEFIVKDQLEIQKLFGSGFAESLVALTPGQWHGPVLSGYSTHLVYVSHVTAPPPPVFAHVRDQVEQEWTAEKGEELKEQFYANLRGQYKIMIEQPTESEKVAAVAGPSR